MKGALRKHWLAFLGHRPERQLGECLEKLSNYCRAPDPNAKGAPDLDEAMKQFIWWPQEHLLGQLESSVFTLARSERKYPERRPWETFELVDGRKKKLRLLKHINDLVGRARERFIEASFSDLEALAAEPRENKDAADLLRDIHLVTEDISVARTIDWARYKGILLRLSANGKIASASGNDTALACYARVLEMIVDHRKWAKLRKESESLVYWLLKIGYPGGSGRDGVEHFNRMASFRWLWEKARRIQQKRESKLEKLRQSGVRIEWDEESRDDARLMELIAKNDLKALETLQQRYWRMVTGIAARVMRNNQRADEIALKVCDKVRAAAPEYVPTPFFKTWLSTVARRTAIDELRRARRRAYGGINEVLSLFGMTSGVSIIEARGPDDSEDWSWQPPEQ